MYAFIKAPSNNPNKYKFVFVRMRNLKSKSENFPKLSNRKNVKSIQ